MKLIEKSFVYYMNKFFVFLDNIFIIQLSALEIHNSKIKFSTLWYFIDEKKIQIQSEWSANHFVKHKRSNKENE